MEFAAFFSIQFNPRRDLMHIVVTVQYKCHDIMSVTDGGITLSPQ